MVKEAREASTEKDTNQTVIAVTAKVIKIGINIGTNHREDRPKGGSLGLDRLLIPPQRGPILNWGLNSHFLVR